MGHMSSESLPNNRAGQCGPFLVRCLRGAFHLKGTGHLVNLFPRSAAWRARQPNSACRLWQVYFDKINFGALASDGLLI